MRPFQQLPFDRVPETPRLPHRYFDAEVRTVRLASPGRPEVRVRVYGSGPPLLLIHGFMTSGYSWRYVLPRLGERFTLYIPDLSGCGESDKPDVSYAPEAMAEALGSLLSALDLRGAPVIGNSMGGYLAMQLMLLDPGSIGRLVNLHSPGLVTGRIRLLSSALTVVPGWRRVVRALVRRDPERWVHRNVHYYDETLKSREEHRIYAAPLREEAGLSAFCRQLDETMSASAMERFEARLRASPIAAPLLLVYARRDPMVPPSVGTALHRLLPDAEMIWLEEASHFAHVDATDRFLDAVLPFLRR